MSVTRDKIDEVLKTLPDKLQEEVLKFANSLLQNDQERDARSRLHSADK
jgi:hypothetical protein